MEQPFVSIIIGFRNRDLQRVKNCLDALANQTVNINTLEVIFVDYGSDEDVSKKVTTLLMSYPFVKYVFTNTRHQFWNRSHALNTGIRLAKAPCIVVSDIDLIVAPTFLEKVGALSFSNCFYTFSCFYLPAQFSIDLKTISEKGIHFQQDYVGLCAFSKTAIETINGFDEYYMVWGVEDDDLYSRLGQSGIERKHKPANEFGVFHQWHPTQRPGFPSFWYITMVNYWSSKRSEKEVFEKAWGKLIEQRPLFCPGNLPSATKVSFDNSVVLYRYNQLIDLLNTTKKQDSVLLDITPYYNLKETGKQKFTFFNKESKHQSVEPDLFAKDIQMIQYFIGTKRDKIIDYQIIINECDFSLQILL